jgi:predicted SAM-dependent methyltransferase
MEDAVVPADQIKKVAAAAAEKNETDKKEIKLNIGSGDKQLDGYMNIDIKNGVDAYPMPSAKKFASGEAWFEGDLGESLGFAATVQEIRASHVLEHFERKEIPEVLANWFEALAPGGWVKIAVPDFRKICEKYLADERINTTGYIMGGQVDEHDFHKTLFDEETLTKYLMAAGFEFIGKWESEIDDCASLPISLNLMGRKPLFEETIKETLEDVGIEAAKAVEMSKDLAKVAEDISTIEETETVSCQIDTSKVSAIMSMPRLAFTDNMFCAMRALMPLQINIHKGSGVFWGQVLTRMIEEQLAAGKEYVITIDYDTWFTKEHVMHLIWLMDQNPQADAIIPVQVKRESEEIMIGIDGDDGKPLKEITLLDINEPLIRTTRGHFGLTILRLSAFTDLKKPWFHAVPSPDGTWSDDRQDEDIAFWNNFAACGKQAYVAKDINIGHIELSCTFPGRIADNWKPVQVGMFKLEENGPPEHCVPAVSQK